MKNSSAISLKTDNLSVETEGARSGQRVLSGQQVGPKGSLNGVGWKECESLDNLSSTGVYALAISRKRLASDPFGQRADIVYFVMTNSKGGLSGRVKQFENTIIDKTGHSGAQRFMYDFESARELVPNLYVAVWAFSCDVQSNKPKDLATMGRVSKAEYECFAKYVELHGRLALRYTYSRY